MSSYSIVPRAHSSISVPTMSKVGTIVTSGVKLKFWDLGGQEELQSLWDKYYAESHAIIYVVDSSDKERIDESKEAFVVNRDGIRSNSL
ncbi:ARFRP-like protein [Mya arenaria]|uniref:ARFRP-like protein n=1 Tax=Mya arenaria TaxID=6604 RepID=A0ABY7FR39_MYAAR|nr:ARFRP-like protein [Mya arenaria]